MKKRFLVGLAMGLFILGGISVNVSATIIDGGNVNGFDTFVDQNTGRVWMDMDSFFNLSTEDMVTAANSAGFIFANKSDVEELLNSLSLSSDEWATIYKPIMMDAPNRELIWGAYDDGDNNSRIGWAFAYSFSTSWEFSDNAWEYNGIPNENTEDADMNIWAYQTSTSVPEPATMLLFGTGLVGLVGLRRRRNKK